MRILSVVLLSWAAPGWAEELRVTLLDHAGVPGALKSRAVGQAGRILAAAGVRARWIELPAPEGIGPFNPLRQPADVFIRILDAPQADRLAPRESIFGFAQPAGTGHFRWLASVFHHRARQLTRDTGAELGVVLGHMMAHEIGHLLLGDNAHSRLGIMRSPWDTQGMKLAGQGRLLFDSDQAARLRANVAARWLAK